MVRDVVADEEGGPERPRGRVTTRPPSGGRCMGPPPSVSLLLRPFEAADEQAAVAAHARSRRTTSTFLLGYEPGMPWSDWLADTERNLRGVDLPADRVRSAFLAAVVDGALVGRVPSGSP